jgi:predicted nucleic acid-binding protein
VVLVDTSIWIEVFRRPARIRLEDVVGFEDIVTCLPVMQEVLQGVRDERAFLLAREAMRALPIVESPVSLAVFDQAIDLYRAARRAGLAVRSSADCLIGACAVRHHLEVLHYDRDYDTLARVSPLRSRRLEMG